MNDNQTHDEMQLIDYLMGRCEGAEGQQVQERLKKDDAYRRLHTNISNTLEALKLSPEFEAPADLVEKTLNRIRQQQQLKSLIAREELSRRPAGRATFSLRELAAMAAVAVLMATVFVPSAHKAQQSALAGQCCAQTGQIGTALSNFAGENDGQLPATKADTQHWLIDGEVQPASNSSGLFRLVRNGFAKPEWFQCPAVGAGSFTVQAGMMDFPAGKFVSYSYQYSIDGKGISTRDPQLQSVANKMAILADSSPVFADAVFHRDRLNAAVSDNHASTGQAVLFMDMHTDWTEKADVGVNGNNIFLVDGVADYSGQEKPSGPADTFLLPTWCPAQK